MRIPRNSRTRKMRWGKRDVGVELVVHCCRRHRHHHQSLLHVSSTSGSLTAKPIRATTLYQDLRRMNYYVLGMTSRSAVLLLALLLRVRVVPPSST